MSKSALMKGMGAKSSTPLRQTEADKASIPAVLREVVLTDEMILVLLSIDQSTSNANTTRLGISAKHI